MSIKCQSSLTGVLIASANDVLEQHEVDKKELSVPLCPHPQLCY